MTLQELIQAQNAKREQGKALMKAGKLEEAKAVKEEVDQLQNDIDAEMMFMANDQLHNAQAYMTGFEAGNPFAKFGAGAGLEVSNNPTNSSEYRQAFMKFVMTGEKTEPLNLAGTTKTGDLGILIPSTVLEKIVSKLENVGIILNLVNRTAVKGGVSIPTSQIKPEAEWVAEGATSTLQKQTAGADITFKYHKLRCAVAQTLEVAEMALAVFEAKLVEDIAKAMIKAIEAAIITGDGVGKPKGITKETPAAGQALDVTAPGYKVLCDAEAALPVEYEEGAVWTMTKKTFYSFAAMVDSTGQPIGRVDHGIAGKVERSLLGRKVEIVSYLPSYETAVAGDVFAFLFNYADYTLNTNFDMGIKRYEDNVTDDIISKAVMLVDGKVTDVNSLVTLTKKL